MNSCLRHSNRTFCSSVKNLNFGPASSERCLSYSNGRIHLGPASLGWYRCLSYSSAPVGIHPDKISIQEKGSFWCREDMTAGREAWPQEAEWTGSGASCKVSGSIPSDLLPLERLHRFLFHNLPNSTTLWRPCSWHGVGQPAHGVYRRSTALLVKTVTVVPLAALGSC